MKASSPSGRAKRPRTSLAPELASSSHYKVSSRSVRTVLALLVLLVTFGLARADEVVLRLASVAPSGTAWARELKAFARDVEAATNGAVRIKWYLGAITGDEAESIARIGRKQLDGGALSV